MLPRLTRPLPLVATVPAPWLPVEPPLTPWSPLPLERVAEGDVKKGAEEAATGVAALKVEPPLPAADRTGRGGRGGEGARGRLPGRAADAERGPCGSCWGGLGGSGAVSTLSTPGKLETMASGGVLSANEHCVLQMLSRRTASTPTSAISWRQLLTRKDWHSACEYFGK